MLLSRVTQPIVILMLSLTVLVVVIVRFYSVGRLHMVTLAVLLMVLLMPIIAFIAQKLILILCLLTSAISTVIILSDL